MLKVQLSRSLLAGRRDARPDCVSVEDSDTECSSPSRYKYRQDVSILFCSVFDLLSLLSRCLHLVSSRGQQVDEDADDVSKLPDIVGS